MKTVSKPPKKRANYEEHYNQCSVVQWFRMQYPRGLIYAVPNSARRSPQQGVWLKAEGLTAGVPDLCLPMSRGVYHGMYVEMKTKGNKPTDSQFEWLNRLTAEGYYCRVCYDSEQAMQEIKNYMAL